MPLPPLIVRLPPEASKLMLTGKMGGPVRTVSEPEPVLKEELVWTAR